MRKNARKKKHEFKVACYLLGRKVGVSQYFHSVRSALSQIKNEPKNIVCVLWKLSGRNYKRIGRYKAGFRVNKAADRARSAFKGKFFKVKGRKTRSDYGRKRKPRLGKGWRKKAIQHNKKMGGSSFHYGSKKQKRASFKAKSRGRRIYA